MTRAISVVGPVVVAAALGGGCTQIQRGLGESCLKDQDCLSGVCSQLACVAAPPLLDGAVTVPTASAEAGGRDATVDAAVAEASLESSSPGDAAPAPSDALADSVDDPSGSEVEDDGPPGAQADSE